MDHRRWITERRSRHRDYRLRVERYVAGVADGDIQAGELVRKACERHLWDMETAARRGLRFDWNEACYAIDFFPMAIKHSVGEFAGERFWLEDWQAFIVASLLGWRRTGDNVRRFRKGYIEIARKNGKSTLVAGIALLLLLFDSPPEPSAEIYLTATKEDQARIIFRMCGQMISSSPVIRDKLNVRQKIIQYAKLDSFIRPLGSDSTGTDGLNPHVVLRDELHAWRPRHVPFAEKLATGGGSRRQPLELTITTAGDEESQLWKATRAYAAKAIKSRNKAEPFDDSVFAFVACLDEKDDVLDEENWPKANPNLGRSVKLDYLRQQAKEAKNDPMKLNQFKRYHFNRIVSKSETLILPSDWAAQDGSPINRGALKQQECFGGFDLGRTDDFSAIALVFPEITESIEPRYTILSRSYCSEDKFAKLDINDKHDWIADGSLVVHPGPAISFDEIESDIVDLSERFFVINWGFDPTFAAQMAQRLEEYHGINIYKFIQSARYYNEPLRRFLRAVNERQFYTGGDGCLGWQICNLQVMRDTRDHWRPDKSGEGKIDAAVATLMAFAGCLFGDTDKTPEVYFA